MIFDETNKGKLDNLQKTLNEVMYVNLYDNTVHSIVIDNTTENVSVIKVYFNDNSQNEASLDLFTNDELNILKSLSLDGNTLLYNGSYLRDLEDEQVTLFENIININYENINPLEKSTISSNRIYELIYAITDVNLKETNISEIKTYDNKYLKKADIVDIDTVDNLFEEIIVNYPTLEEGD